MLGFYDVVRDGPFQAFLWENGVFTTLDIPFDGPVALGASAYQQPKFTPHGDILINGGIYSDGVFTQIMVPGAVSTAITGVNARGQIVGTYRDSDDRLHGFLAEPIARQ